MPSLIQRPYLYEPDEQIILRDTPQTNGKVWKKKGFAPIKNNIKEHYLSEQQWICPYCYLEMRRYGDDLDIEHIVPKGIHPNFMFEPKNLAVSCRHCNRTKKVEETLVNSTVTIYPTNGNGFQIIHPHFDDYWDYMELTEDNFLKAKIRADGSNKGTETIRICKLTNPKIAEERERQLSSSGIKKLETKLVSKLRGMNLDSTIMEDIMSVFKVLNKR